MMAKYDQVKYYSPTIRPSRLKKIIVISFIILTITLFFFVTSLIVENGRPNADAATISSLSGTSLLNRSSDEWLPIKVDQCTKGMHFLSAPCFKDRHPNSNLIVAEELIYSAFRIKLPEFVNQIQKNQWIENMRELERMKISKNQEWANYPSVHGQNLIFTNAIYRGRRSPPTDSWSDKACMGVAVSALDFFNQTIPENRTGSIENSVDHLVIATTPDSWSFQHFLDRVTVVWSQALLSIAESDLHNVTVLSGSPVMDSIVDPIYNRMGVRKHLHELESISAKYIHFSCRAPLVHPFSTQRLNDLMAINKTFTDNIKDSKRNIIMMMPRGTGNEYNGGRSIRNQKELNDSIIQLINQRKKNETFLIFEAKNYDSLDAILNIMSRVKAIISPHGASLYNARFAHIDTLVLEVMPIYKGKINSPPMFWEQSRLLEQKYAIYLAESVNSKDDMKITDIDEFIKFLNYQLDEPKSIVLEKSYNYVAE